MLNSLLRPTLAAFIIAIAVIGLIRTRPVDDSALRAVFAPDGCAQPCFMGIQPGVTDRAALLRLLKDHAWVADVSHQADDTRERVSWRWGTRSPAFLHANFQPYILLAADRVEFVRVYTHVPAYQMHVLFGRPGYCQAGWVMSNAWSLRQFYPRENVNFFYHYSVNISLYHQGLTIDARDLWQRETAVEYVDDLTRVYPNVERSARPCAPRVE